MQRQQLPQQKRRPVIKPKHGEIRVVVLGGVSEIGKNMYMIEYNGSIVLLECGTAFGESTMPGVQTVMPNTEYLQERKKDIKAVVVTDASLTHAGALNYVVNALGGRQYMSVQ